MKHYRCHECGHENKAVTAMDAAAPKCELCACQLIAEDEILEAGTILAGFEIKDVIGQGGMGCVYRATQQSMGRTVALKVLHKSFSKNEQFLRQFIAEAKTTGQIRHRGIVTALDAGNEGDRYFLAMNYIDGENLEAKLERREVVPEKVAIRIAIKIAGALAHVLKYHQLYHRDIKPSNIALDRSGEPFLLDLGIAKFSWESSADNERVMGTPYYMSPEQCKGRELDWRTDQYSLGATLYHIVAGFPPFDSPNTRQILEAHAVAEFPLPSKRGKDVSISDGCVKLISKMMEKKPENRFESWEAFISAAETYLNGQPSTPPASKPVESPAKKTSKTVKKAKLVAPVPAGQAGGGVAGDRKSGGHSFVPYLVLAIVIAAIGAGYYFLTRQSEAQILLEKANVRLKEHPRDYDTALDFLAQASKLSAPGSKWKTTIDTRYAEIKQEAEDYRAAQEKLKPIKLALVQARELAEKKRFSESWKLLKPLKDVPDAALAKEIADLSAYVWDKVKGEELLLKQKEAAEAAKREKAREKARLAELVSLAKEELKLKERDVKFKLLVNDALDLIRRQKHNQAIALLRKSSISPELKERLKEAEALIENLTEAENTVKEYFKANIGKTIDVSLKSHPQPVPITIRSLKKDTVVGIPKGKVIGVKFQLRDLDDSMLSRIKFPVTGQRYLAAALFAMRAGETDRALKAAADAGPYADTLMAALRYQDRFAENKKISKEFVALLGASFQFPAVDSFPTPNELLTAIKGASISAASPGEARAALRRFGEKYADSDFMALYNDCFALAKGRLWTELPLGPADLFRAKTVKFDVGSGLLTLEYDFSDKDQLKDWPDGKLEGGKLIRADRQPLYHQGVFSSVKVKLETKDLDKNVNVLLLSTALNEGVLFKARSTEDTFAPGLFLIGPDNQPKPLSKAKGSDIEICGDAVYMSYEDNRLIVSPGKGKITRDLKNFGKARVGVVTGDSDARFDKIVLVGTLDPDWTKQAAAVVKKKLESEKAAAASDAFGGAL